MDDPKVVADRLYRLLEKADGTEIGSLEQVYALLNAAQLTWAVHGDTVYVTGVDGVYVVGTRSRAAMQKWALREGMRAEMQEEGERFAPLNRVVAAMLAATVGDPCTGAGTPVVWKAQHAQRLKMLEELKGA